jgi:hypothetical protein
MIVRRLFWSTWLILAAAIGLAVAASFLPDRPYQRFQLLDDTIYGHVRWSYERMRFDPRPIDVAIVGDSRTLMGLRTGEMQRRLAANGRPWSVVNMSQEGDGRNAQWILVQELLKHKQPKVIVLAANEQPHPWGHDSFRYIAPAPEVWREAGHGLHNAGKDLMYLPFRQIRLFAASFAPGPFGLQDRFDPAIYASEPSDYADRYRNAAGEWIDLRNTWPRDQLLGEAGVNQWRFTRHSRLPRPVRAVTDADDRVYTKLIAAAAARHGVKLMFVYQPGFTRSGPIANRAFYEALGAVQDDTDLNDRDDLFYDWAHVNTAGAMVVSDRVADALAKMP